MTDKIGYFENEILGRQIKVPIEPEDPIINFVYRVIAREVGRVADQRIAEQQDLINKHVKFIESLRDTLTRGGEEFKEQEQRIAEQQGVIDELKLVLSGICDAQRNMTFVGGRRCGKSSYAEILKNARKLLGENNG